MTRATRHTVDLVLTADWLARLRASVTGGEITYLGKLLARATSRALCDSASVDWPGLLGALWGAPLSGWPSAAFALAGEDPCQLAKAFDAPARWWRADPVHLLAAIDHVRLAAAGPALALSKEDANTLASPLQDHLRGVGLDLEVLSATRWYLRANRPWNAQSVATAFAAGRDLRALLTTGPDATALLGLATECQMLLSQAPLNEGRDQCGLPTVNSLWLWGGGVELLPELPAWAAALPRLVSAEPELLGAWAYAGRLDGNSHADAGSPGARRARLLEALAGPGNLLIVLDAAYLDATESAQASRVWLEAVLAKLVARRGTCVRLVAGASLWQFPTGLRARRWWPSPARVVDLTQLLDGSGGRADAHPWYSRGLRQPPPS
ncbi:MAG: hypothetical protein AAGA68_12250 [Pseudomonadota bacterium]